MSEQSPTASQPTERDSAEMVRRRRARSEAEGEEAGALRAADEQKRKLHITSLGAETASAADSRGALGGGSGGGGSLEPMIVEARCGVARWLALAAKSQTDTTDNNHRPD
ncbi:MAG: hypothetical protein GVY36_15475 [Verrucomicrobia bacterium]|nr:hypothetical protein [Verrucomicrobiota bacterium]